MRSMRAKEQRSRTQPCTMYVCMFVAWTHLRAGQVAQPRVVTLHRVDADLLLDHVVSGVVAPMVVMVLVMLSPGHVSVGRQRLVV